MSLVVAASVAASLTAMPNCSWDRPGHDPFMGDVVQAIDRYTDIPQPVRETLKRRMAVRQYDEIVSIRRDSIVGRNRYDSTIRDMHFGPGRLCKTVSRSRWDERMHERGLVYCEREHCILVPTVCRNVSRVRPLPDETAADLVQRPALKFDDGQGAGGGGAFVAALPSPTLQIDPTPGDGEMSFEPPGAGPMPGHQSFEILASAGPDGQAGLGPARGEVAGPSPDAPPVPLVPPTQPPESPPFERGPGPLPPPPLLPPLTPTVPPTLRPPIPPIHSLEPPMRPVPEPGTWLLLVAGLVTLAGLRRRR